MGKKHNLQEWLFPLGRELSTKYMGEKENAVSVVERNNCYHVKNSSYIQSYQADRPKLLKKSFNQPTCGLSLPQETKYSYSIACRDVVPTLCQKRSPRDMFWA